MRKFKSLKPQNLPEGYDLEVYSETPYIEVKESKNKIAVHYSFPGFYLSDDKRELEGKKPGFKKLEIESVGYLAESGKPLLPSFGRYVQIPHDCDYKVTVTKGAVVEFDDIAVTPAQNISDSPGRKEKFQYDEKLYAKDTLYPEEIVNVSGPFSIDEYLALLVHVTPFQYNPAKKKLVGYGDITVTIEVTEKMAEQGKAASSTINDPAIGNLLLNPGSSIKQKLGLEPSPIIIRRIGPELLIIYANMFKNAAEKLADWKNRKGIITETVNIDSIGNTTQQIKSYIRGRRKTLFTRLRYVMFFGDSDAITPEKGLPSMYGPGSNTTDYYYSTRYDAQTPDPVKPNQKWFLPWLAVGRIAMRTEADGMAVVDQIIAYEKNPPADQAFYKRITLAAAYQSGRGYLSTINYLYDKLAALGYDVERVYVNDEPGQPTDPPNVPLVSNAQATQMLIDATNEGQLFIGHRDHGNWDGWVIPSFKLTDLDKVSSDSPSVFYSINCQTGIFDVEPRECWAEKNLRMKGTAPSLIAATRNSDTYMNNSLIQGIFDGTFGGVLPTFPGGTASYPVKNNRLGDLLNYGKAYLPTQSTAADYIRDEFEIYHVIGDPTLQLWTELPKIVSIKAQLFRLQLSLRLSECPTGTTITLWYGTKLLKTLEPTSTTISIPLTGLVPAIKGPLPILKRCVAICFSAPGYRYHEERVPLPL